MNAGPRREWMGEHSQAPFITLSHTIHIHVCEVPFLVSWSLWQDIYLTEIFSGKNTATGEVTSSTRSAPSWSDMGQVTRIVVQ